MLSLGLALLLLASGEAVDRPREPTAAEKSLLEASSAGDVEGVRALLAAGARLETRDVEGYTAIMRAVCAGHDDVVALLERARASSDEAREAALCCAIQNGDTERALRQIRAGLNLRWPCGQFGDSFLMDAVDRDQLEIVRALVEAGADLHAANSFGTMPWDRAVLEGHDRIAGVLKAAGANPDALDPWGNTALHRASFRAPDDPGPVRSLVEAGAGVDARDEWGETPLMAAAARGAPRTVRALIELGADLNLRDAEGRTALQIAEAAIAEGDVPPAGLHEVGTLLKAAAKGPSEWASVRRAFPATVVGTGVRARSGPDTYAEVVFGLQDGESVSVLGLSPDTGDRRWYHVETAPGKRGWVRGDLLQAGFRPEEVARLRASREGAVLHLVTITGPSSRKGAAGKCTALVEPILVFSRGRLSQAVVLGELVGEKVGRDVYRKYLPRGRSYRLFLGGAEAGTVTVGRPEEVSCVSLVARGEVGGALQCRKGVFALATDSPVIGSKRSSRRALTDEETRRVQALARERFEARGQRQELAKGGPIAVRSALAADLDGDGRDELLASAHFTVPPERKDFLPDRSHEVAFVVEEGVARELWRYDGDYEMGARAPLVDHLDLDGDGTSEVVLRLSYYETWDFGIFRRVDGEWVQVYLGGGGGC